MIRDNAYCKQKKLQDMSHDKTIDVLPFKKAWFKQKYTKWLNWLNLQVELIVQKLGAKFIYKGYVSC